MVTVVNKHKHTPTTRDIYIGRGSALGNPFSHLAKSKALVKVATRQEAVEKYKGWLQEKVSNQDYAVVRELRRILALHQAGEVCLVCYCKPLSCHGDVIKCYIENHPTLFSQNQ